MPPSDNVTSDEIARDWKITDPKVVCTGLTARPLSTGFVYARLHYSADPETFTPETIAEEKRRIPGWRSRKEYEIDANAQAGQPVFEPEWLDKQRASCRDPIYRMDMDESGNLVRRQRGRVMIFVEPTEQPPGMPDMIERVDRTCGIGMDVGEGVAASNSTIQVLFSDIREQAAEFACNRIRPANLGKLAVAVAQYYNNALICCVRKMHGLTVLRKMADDLKYPYLWHARAADHLIQKKSEMLGWARGEMSDEYLVGPLLEGLEHGTFLLRGLTTVGELGQYIYDEVGRITHQRLVDVPVNERRRHGDLVVALALAERACRDMPFWRNVRRKRRRPLEDIIERQMRERASRIWRR